MKKLNEELFPGDLIEIESKVYECIKSKSPRECIGCAFTKEEHCQLYEADCYLQDVINIGCTRHDVILVEQPQVFKPTLLVVGESIEILGVKLLIKRGLNCDGCILHSTVLCLQVDCQTNGCVISNKVSL